MDAGQISDSVEAWMSDQPCDKSRLMVIKAVFHVEKNTQI